MTEASGKHWVFFRGLAREARHWGTFPEKFQERFPKDKIHLVDLPGTGSKIKQSSPVTIPSIMRSVRSDLQREVGTGPWHFLALSLGGMVALSWMNQYPEEVAGSVVVNSSSQLSPFYHRLRWESWKAFLASVSKVDPKAREQGILQLISNNEKARNDILPLWAKIGRTSTVSPKTLLVQLSAAGRYRVPTRILGSKALFLSSLGDRLVEPACSEDLAAHFQSPIVRHPWAGHDIPIDDPEWLLKEIASWLQTGQRKGSEVTENPANP